MARRRSSRRSCDEAMKRGNGDSGAIPVNLQSDKSGQAPAFVASKQDSQNTSAGRRGSLSNYKLREASGSMFAVSSLLNGENLEKSQPRAFGSRAFTFEEQGTNNPKKIKAGRRRRKNMGYSVETTAEYQTCSGVKFARFWRRNERKGRRVSWFQG